MSQSHCFPVRIGAPTADECGAVVYRRYIAQVIKAVACRKHVRFGTNFRVASPRSSPSSTWTVVWVTASER